MSPQQKRETPQCATPVDCLPTLLSSSERWARLRFAIVGPLLASPPAPGDLKHAIDELAKKTWQHPISDAPVHFAFATIERWFYQARAAHQDPVAVLQRKRRADAGQSRRLSAALASSPCQRATGHRRFGSHSPIAASGHRINFLLCYPSEFQTCSSSGSVFQTPPEAGRTIGDVSNPALIRLRGREVAVQVIGRH